MLLLHIITFIPTGIQSANDKHWCYGAYGTPQVRGEGSASLVLRRLFGEEARSLEVGLSEIGAFQFWMFNIIIFPIKKYKNAHTHGAPYNYTLFSNTPKSFCVQWRWVKCLSAVWFDLIPWWIWWLPGGFFRQRGSHQAGEQFLSSCHQYFFSLYIQRKSCAIRKEMIRRHTCLCEGLLGSFFLNKKPFWFLVCQHAISLRKKNIYITYYVNYIIHA